MCEVLAGKICCAELNSDAARAIDGPTMNAYSRHHFNGNRFFDFSPFFFFRFIARSELFL